MAKFFVRGTKAKWDAIADKTAYNDSIVFLEDAKQIIQNGVVYGGDFDTELGKLKYFSVISGNSGSASAPAPNSTLIIKGDGTVLKTTVDSNGMTVSVATMKGATASAAGEKGLVPKPAAGDQAKVLSGAGTWISLPTLNSLSAVPTSRTITAGTGLTGGGSLTNNVTISHGSVGAKSSTKEVEANNYVSGVEIDQFGHVTGVASTALPTLSDLGGVADTVSVTGSDGLTGGGVLTTSQTIKHAVPSGASAKTSGLYKITTDKFGHVTGTADPSTSDIKKLTGYVKGTNAEITATDSLNVALGKAQGLIDALKESTQGLTGAMHFRGVVSGTTLPATTDYEAGDVIIWGGKEYVLNTGDTGKKWEEFGDLSLIGQLNSKVSTLESKPGLDRTGTVTSVDVSAVTGSNLTATDGPITTSGTINIGVADGYTIPSDTDITSWNNKVSFPGYATAAPKANGTATVGTSTKVAREDHVHPLLTTISGNAGTSSKLQTARTIALGQDATGSVSFDGSKDVTINVSLEWEEL